MSELSIQRIQDAKEVCRALGINGVYYSMDLAIEELEFKQAAEAKREKRIDELVWLMFKRDYPESNGPTGIGYRKYAEAVIEAFPAIVDGGSDE